MRKCIPDQNLETRTQTSHAENKPNMLLVGETPASALPMEDNRDDEDDDRDDELRRGRSMSPTVMSTDAARGEAPSPMGQIAVGTAAQPVVGCIIHLTRSSAMVSVPTRTLCCLGCLLACCNAADAQSKKPTPAVNSAALRALDKEAERLQQEFVDSLVTLADGYEQAGDLEKAQQTLARVLELDPQRESIQQRLDEMKNRVFDSNEVELEVDVVRGWTSTGLKVRKGEPVRIVAEGSYKLILNANISPDGVSTEDLNRDMSGEAKLGQLMGMVFPPPEGRQKPRPGKPFAIGTEREITPDEGGMLFLRLNVPAGTKSVGTVRVKVSGNIERG